MDHKAFEQEVRRMRMKCSDAIDDPSDAACQQMVKQLQRLEDDAQVGKSPASLNSRLKDMRRTAEELVNGSGMSYGDADMIRDWVEDCLRNIR